MKKTFAVDWLMLVLFIASFYTGHELHVAGRAGIHEIWHNLAVAHILVNLLFFIIGIWHIKLHRAWYKSLFHVGFGNHSKITLVLSVLFLLVTFSGLYLLCVEGICTKIGMLHYAFGLLFSVLSVLHIGKRISKVHHKRSMRANC